LKFEIGTNALTSLDSFGKWCCTISGPSKYDCLDFTANHFISSTKHSSAQECWSALACISDSVAALHPIFMIIHWI